MEKKKGAVSPKRKRKKRLGRICTVCWIILPAVAVLSLVLDGLGLYPFSTERLLVIGVSFAVALLPFVSEVTVRGISVKKERK